MQEFHIEQVGTEVCNPSSYGATAPCRPWPPTEDASILLSSTCLRPHIPRIKICNRFSLNPVNLFYTLINYK